MWSSALRRWPKRFRAVLESVLFWGGLAATLAATLLVGPDDPVAMLRRRWWAPLAVVGLSAAYALKRSAEDVFSDLEKATVAQGDQLASLAEQNRRLRERIETITAELSGKPSRDLASISRMIMEGRELRMVVAASAGLSSGDRRAMVTWAQRVREHLNQYLPDYVHVFEAPVELSVPNNENLLAVTTFSTQLIRLDRVAEELRQRTPLIGYWRDS